MQQHLRYKRDFNTVSVQFVVYFILAAALVLFGLRMSQVRVVQDLVLVAPISVVLALSLLAAWKVRTDRLETAMAIMLTGSSLTMLAACYVFGFSATIHFWMVQAALLVCAGGVFSARRVLLIVIATLILLAVCYSLQYTGLYLGRDYGPFATGWMGLVAVSMLIGLLGIQSVRFATMFDRTIVDLTSSSERLARVVADQARTTQRLQDSEERYRLLLEHTPVALARYDRSYQVTYCNPLLPELFGLQVDNTHTINLEQLASPGMMRLLRGAIDGQTGQFESLHVNASNGRQWWMDLYCSPVRDSVGTVVGAVAAVRDDSERRKRELELSVTRDTAEKASQAKNRFLALMSHEIRTPMNGVYGSAQLLTDTRLPESKREAVVNTILRSSKSLMTLLDDILDTSKIEAGLIELVEKRFEPSVLLRETTELFQQSAAQKGLSLYCAWQGEDPGYLKGDSARLRQMLSNLVGNAVKYTPTGFIQVQGEILGSGDTGTVVKFSVTDSGLGIEKETQLTLFQPFSRARDSVTQSIEGTGLGLSIVKQLASLMGGDVGVVSEPGHGSTFWFIVNLGSDERDPWDDGSDDDDDEEGFMPSDAPPTGQQTTAQVGLKNQEKHTMKILLVEDNPTNAQLVQDMLELEGFAVSHALNGQEALDALYERNLDVDVILMDCRMPVMDGYECTQRIRSHESANPADKRMPIIALTANVFEDDRNRCMQVGMDDFLRKPVDLAELVKTLKKHAG